jgi:FAD dependent oxidoreductase
MNANRHKGKTMRLSRRQFVGVLGAGAIQASLHHAPVSAAESGDRSYDLVVVGIGSGGFGAALAGARQGLSVLCVEKSDRIGGNAVQSGVTMWEPGVGGTGFPFEIYKRLKPVPNAVGVYSFGRHISWDGWEKFPGGEHVVDPTHGYADTLRRHRSREKNADAAFRKEYWHGVVFEPDAYEKVLREMLAETERVTVLTETTFDEVEMVEGRIASLRLTNGDRVTAGAYIDGTGGGALCKACGCAMMFGQEGKDTFGEPSAADKPNDRINGVTLIFRITRTEEPRVEPLPEGVPKDCWWGRFPAMSAVKYPNNDYNCNMLPTMEGRDFAKRDYQDAYAECLRRIKSFWHHVQTKWPEFQGYRMAWVAPALGVRETSRVTGEYVLTEQDLRAGLSGQNHPDIITIADHSIDRHGAGGGGGEMGEPYGVPYRCLVPKGFSNLLVACRGSSFSSLAASSCRLSRTMMQLGQAAGTAAGLAAQLNTDLPSVPPERLRSALRDQHVELDWPRPPELEAYLREE